MQNNLTTTVHIDIDAPAKAVWQTLTDPDKIAQWLFGTKTTCDWKKGSPITYTGEWQGKQYIDKGTILEIEPHKLLVMDYWSSFSGQPDTPENYQKITYRLDTIAQGTRLTVIQENHRSEETRAQSEGHWQQALVLLKRVSES
ncbi:MAG TPA: SRPBCC domain-containing protein [Turneriella sp.]|nr:SRPBCC domain-containing protein [Turneriella sp.]